MRVCVCFPSVGQLRISEPKEKQFLQRSGRGGRDSHAFAGLWCTDLMGLRSKDWLNREQAPTLYTSSSCFLGERASASFRTPNLPNLPNPKPPPHPTTRPARRRDRRPGGDGLRDLWEAQRREHVPQVRSREEAAARHVDLPAAAQELLGATHLIFPLGTKEESGGGAKGEEKTRCSKARS